MQTNNNYWFTAWGKKRERGIWFYVLVENGLALAGVALIIRLWQYFSAAGWGWPPFSDAVWVQHLLRYMAIFAVGGIVLGVVKWYLNEKRYKKYTTEQ